MATLESWTKVLTMVGAVCAFAWGVVQFSITQRQQVESRRIEARKPFLERQLTLYTEATQLASAIATTRDVKKRSDAVERYWSLYWGELALVEDRRVEGAMVKFGQALEAGADADLIKQQSLELAHACRESLAASWGVKDWQNPDK